MKGVEYVRQKGGAFSVNLLKLRQVLHLVLHHHWHNADVHTVLSSSSTNAPHSVSVQTDITLEEVDKLEVTNNSRAKNNVRTTVNFRACRQSNTCILGHYVQSNSFNTQILTKKILQLHLNNDGQSVTPLHV